jgi:hypothetical protein
MQFASVCTCVIFRPGLPRSSFQRLRWRTSPVGGIQQPRKRTNNAANAAWAAQAEWNGLTTDTPLADLSHGPCPFAVGWSAPPPLTDARLSKVRGRFDAPGSLRTRSTFRISTYSRTPIVSDVVAPSTCPAMKPSRSRCWRCGRRRDFQMTPFSRLS